MQTVRTENALMRDMFMVSLYSLGCGLVSALVLGLAVLLMAAPAQAGPEVTGRAELPQMEVEDAQRGSLILKLASGGVSVDAPLLYTDVKMKISGMSARVKVEQKFSNPGSEWVEGIYVFPLPEDSAVDRMRLRIGERIIEGEIREKEEAKREYEQARREGKRASLLSQERPNIFTTAVANIEPGGEVVVEIEYQQVLIYDSGLFGIRFPLVVGPRYIPGTPVAVEESSRVQGGGWAFNTDQVPDASRITPPVVDPAAGKVNPVSIGIELDAGFPLAAVESPYHAIEASVDEAGLHRIRLEEGNVAADRDFVLNWRPRLGSEPQAAFFSEQWEGENYGLLMVMPPSTDNAPTEVQGREMVFVIDTSGSMHGLSMQQAKAALAMALKRLGKGDRFNVIQFDDRTDALFPVAVPATSHNLKRALRYVSGLDADGGTEMLPALKLALDGRSETPLLRQVVFLTDGSVGNEEALFEVIKQRLGASRLFTVGIGSAPNSFFMTRAAEFGRGTFTYIGDVSEVKQKMSALFAKLESPMLTDIEADWAGAQVSMWPGRIPDLYLGEPVILTLKTDRPLNQLVLKGKRSGREWQRQIQLNGGGVSSGIHALWARRKIADLMDQKVRGRDEREVRGEVVALALAHRLVSKYTSLVAVDKTPVRPLEADLASKQVPTNLPHGWSANKVFGQMPQTATPAPLLLLAGLLFLSAGWFARRFGRRELDA